MVVWLGGGRVVLPLMEQVPAPPSCFFPPSFQGVVVGWGYSGVGKKGV